MLFATLTAAGGRGRWFSGRTPEGKGPSCPSRARAVTGPTRGRWPWAPGPGASVSCSVPPTASPGRRSCTPTPGGVRLSPGTRTEQLQGQVDPAEPLPSPLPCLSLSWDHGVYFMLAAKTPSDCPVADPAAVLLSLPPPPPPPLRGAAVLVLSYVLALPGLRDHAGISCTVLERSERSLSIFSRSFD